MIELTFPAVIGAALIDSINPCAFAVLAILMTTALTIKDRKRALIFGICYTASIYISYLAMGLGLRSIIELTNFSRYFYIIASLLAITLGIHNIKDYIWYEPSVCSLTGDGKNCKAPKFIGWFKNLSSPLSALVIGFLVSLFELPCTGGPYIVILSLLSQQTSWLAGFLYLLLYNAIFVLPLIAIVIVIHEGFASVERMELYKEGSLRKMNLLAGIVLILIGIGMIVSLVKAL